MNQDNQAVRIDKWSTEEPFTVLAALYAAMIWFVVVISIFGLVYGFILGLFFFVGHIVFVSHIRGSGVRIGTQQYPELNRRLEELCTKFGVHPVPEAYVIQAGGTLNAMATKLFNTGMIIIYSDLLDACDGDESARDMILAHELGHLHAGHLKWHWFFLPAQITPFIGTALSRAREYTCDRYGLVGAGDRRGALKGLAILAAGPKLARSINYQAFARQKQLLNTGWMTLGEWLSTHPPLCKRIHALDEGLLLEPISQKRGVMRALSILGTVYFLPMFILMGFLITSPWFFKKIKPPIQQGDESDYYELPNIPKSPAEIQDTSLKTLVDFVESERLKPDGLPLSHDELRIRWEVVHPGVVLPKETSSQHEFEYVAGPTGSYYVIYGLGPDGERMTADDLLYQTSVEAPE